MHNTQKARGRKNPSASRLDHKLLRVPSHCWMGRTPNASRVGPDPALGQVVVDFFVSLIGPRGLARHSKKVEGIGVEEALKQGFGAARQFYCLKLRKR